MMNRKNIISEYLLKASVVL
ncbi:hypothetical protein CIY_09650 [Butyrivibrio fibrisolvens 16/4]|nr:hypothetical protein CIY_09650 [Butyrivibrio fibrisolvens 16/4]